ncbi:MAG: protein phosphatase 2C domain-containing protein [Bifidobacteriaceae bacterium]|jgi:protein phosphatase|nr:protein phosphatase 2C domain-containing protein [Bifidobacteriaceae bacterium]
MTTTHFGLEYAGALGAAAGRSGPARWVEFCALTERGPTLAVHEEAVVIGGAALLAPGMRLEGWLPLGGEGLALAVIDGMGGQAGGSAAAGVVAHIVATEAVRVDDAVWSPWLEDVANRVAAAGQAWATPQMGAAAAVMRLWAARVELASLGDCRIYWGRDGGVEQLTVDHRVAGGGPAVTQFLGGVGHQLEPHLRSEELGPGEIRFALCSDGLGDAVPLDELAAILLSEGRAADICDRLATAVWQRGAYDNFSLAVAVVGASGAQPPAERPGLRLD